MKLSTRAEAAEQTRAVGSSEIPTWGNRALSWGIGEKRSFIGSGLISRFINDLSNPLPFLMHDAAREGAFVQDENVVAG